MDGRAAAFGSEKEKRNDQLFIAPLSRREAGGLFPQAHAHGQVRVARGEEVGEVRAAGLTRKKKENGKYIKHDMI